MHTLALATDYDGTLAAEGHVKPIGVKALEALRKAGIRLILVTGRELNELKQVFPDYRLCDRIVAENGALLFDPSSGREKLLAAPANQEFARRLRERNAERLAVGRSVVATIEPYHLAAFELIREMRLELDVIFNKGSVMILPAGVTKETGLLQALMELGISASNVVAVGDAENDHAMLSVCGYGVAVRNALQELKNAADWVTRKARTDGVMEVIERILMDDLPRRRRRSQNPDQGLSGPTSVIIS